MVTHVTINCASNSEFYCTTNTGSAFWINAFENGTLTVEPSCTENIHKFAKTISGCFEKGSNLYGIKCIKFDFSGVNISVTAENANPEAIVNLYYEKIRN